MTCHSCGLSSTLLSLGYLVLKGSVLFVVCHVECQLGIQSWEFSRICRCDLKFYQHSIELSDFPCCDFSKSKVIEPQNDQEWPSALSHYIEPRMVNGFLARSPKIVGVVGDNYPNEHFCTDLVVNTWITIFGNWRLFHDFETT